MKVGTQYDRLPYSVDILVNGDDDDVLIRPTFRVSLSGVVLDSLYLNGQFGRERDAIPVLSNIAPICL